MPPVVGWALALAAVWTGCTGGGGSSRTQPPVGTEGAAEREVGRSVTLNVFAAASLSEAFNELGVEFTGSHPGVEVVFNFAGSNQLAQQIKEGALADVFASANAAQMEVAVDSGRVDRAAVLTLVQNRLVVIYPAANPGALAALEDLANPGLKIVLAAPEVPVGRYSLDFLDRAALEPAYGHTFREAVLANVVSYEENVRVVLTKVVLGEADAGIVYTSDTTGVAPGTIGRLEIPDPLNIVARYPIAALADSANPELAQTFVDWVVSPPGQAVLARHGFTPVK